MNAPSFPGVFSIFGNHYQHFFRTDLDETHSVSLRFVVEAKSPRVAALRALRLCMATEGELEAWVVDRTGKVSVQRVQACDIPCGSPIKGTLPNLKGETFEVFASIEVPCDGLETAPELTTHEEAAECAALILREDQGLPNFEVFDSNGNRFDIGLPEFTGQDGFLEYFIEQLKKDLGGSEGN